MTAHPLEADALSEPLGEPGLVHLPSRDGQHRLFGLVDVGRVGVPHAVVEVDEQHERRPRRALVAVGQRVVPREMAAENSGLVVEVRVEVLVAEAGSWRVQRAVGEVDPTRLDEVAVSTPVTCSANQKYSARPM